MISGDGISLGDTSEASRPSQTYRIHTGTPVSSGKADIIRRGTKKSRSNDGLQFDCEQKSEQDIYRSNCSQSSQEAMAHVNDDSQGSDDMEECLVCKRLGNLCVTLQVL